MKLADVTLPTPDRLLAQVGFAKTSFAIIATLLRSDEPVAVQLAQIQHITDQARAELAKDR